MGLQRAGGGKIRRASKTTRGFATAGHRELAAFSK